MAENAYIELDGKKYVTTAKSWTPEAKKPSTFRLLADNSVDAAYGPGPLNTISGEIIARVSEDRVGYGSYSDIETTLKKRGAITFVDHYGDSHDAHCDGYKRRSLGPNWHASSNKFYYMVTLIFGE